jgi:Zn-dependent protease with chaperone function
VMAYLLSALVLLLPITGLFGGLALLAFYRPLWLSVLFAVTLLGAAFLFRPRANHLPSDAHFATRDQAPRLYDLLDRIAEAIGTEPVTAVVVGTEPTVWFGRIGWRFRPVVGIGLPLWLGLGPQERVAVLAHELGHGKNGDARHGWVVGSAWSILAELRATFSEQPLDEYRRDVSYSLNPEAAYVSLFTRLVNAVLGGLVRCYSWLLAKAALRSSHRAEYLADLKAADIAGSEAASRALERTLLAESGYFALERAVRFERDREPLELVRREVDEIPAREVERRIRASRTRETRINSTHPPTYLRIRLIRRRPATSAGVVLGLNDNAAIDRELAIAGEPALAQLRRRFPA